MADVDDSSLAGAAATVYAVLPEEFLATRTRLASEAKSAGDKPLAAAIGKLRKPSVSAWALNLLAHRHHPVLAEVRDLGDRMRSATSRLDVAELAALRPDRDRALARLVDSAAEVVEESGRALSPSGRDEVRDTGIAALADAAAQGVLESGTLVRALSYSGFGEVDLSDAAVLTSTGRVLGVIRGGRADVGASGTAADAEAPTEAPVEAEVEVGRRAAAEAALADAEAAVAAASRDVATAEEVAEAARERRETAERQLEAATEAERQATERLTEAKRTRRAAERARHTAEDALDAVD